MVLGFSKSKMVKNIKHYPFSTDFEEEGKKKAETHFHHTIKNRSTEKTYCTCEHEHRHHIQQRHKMKCNPTHILEFSHCRHTHIASATHSFQAKL